MDSNDANANTNVAEGLESSLDEEYSDALSRLDDELKLQYNTRKQLLLRAMMQYLGQKEKVDTSGSGYLYGTLSFEHVWQDVCSVICYNKMDWTLKDLGLEIPAGRLAAKDGKIDESTKLKDVIDTPEWHLDDINYTIGQTLEPDIITVTKESYRDGKRGFIIYDAKYYIVSSKGGNLSGQPGIGSITKQYLYQLAYNDFIAKNNLAVRNCFLLPAATEGDRVNRGDVSLGFFHGFVPGRYDSDGTPIKLERIQVISIPVRMAYECYLSDTHLDLSYFEFEEQLSQQA